MADFDINDRGTWAWIKDVPISGAPGDLLANPRDRHSFYQIDQNGVPHLHQCGLADGDGNQYVFNPDLGVCVWPADMPGDAGAYDQYVRDGYVTDQRQAGVDLVTSDDHDGLVNAIASVLPGAAWQRCRTHYADLGIMPTWRRELLVAAFRRKP